MTVDTLLEQYGVDHNHARHVADMALKLFDHLREAYDLPASARALLETGALLHNVALNVNERQHHVVGRDLVLQADLGGLSANERNLVACLVSFHRKRVRPEHEPTYLSLSKKEQHLALRLAALLRVADGLDYSESQTTRIATCDVRKNKVLLHLSGSDASEDGARALKKADLWQQVFPHTLTVVEVSTEEVGSITSAEAITNGKAAIPPMPALTESDLQVQAALTSADTVAELGRRLLRRHFQRLLSYEQGVREDTDIEAVHQLRVSTRRLRAVLQSLQGVAPASAVKTFRKELRRLAQAASTVRDCDVFLEQIAHYTEQLPEEQRAGLSPLTSALQRERATAHSQLLKRLASKRHARLKRDFAAFMTSEPDGWDTTLRVCDMAGSTIWQRYEALRAHEVHLDPIDQVPDPLLHEARISGKQLRYVLEMFKEVLDPRVGEALGMLKEFQEVLGSFQDIAVAKDYVTALEVPDKHRSALDAYVASREAERIELLARLPGLWDKLTQATYRRKLMAVIVKL